MKILHIIPDDKFWLCPIQIFSPLPFENEYVSIVDGHFSRFQYIKSHIIPCGIDECKQLWQREDIDVFMFHSLPSFVYDMILEIPQRKTVIISTWGYDIYYCQNGLPPIYPIKLYQKKTNVYVNKIDALTPLRTLYHTGKAAFRIKSRKKEKERLHSDYLRQVAVVARADYWSTVLPTEFELLSKIHGFKAQYFPFQYVTKESSNNSELMDFANANRILIGNSADPSNNHLDLLELVKKRKITNQLYMPLAYGNQDYACRIEEYVHKRKIDALVQRQFVPYGEYISILHSCRVGIFGHLRQQAVGNISACLMQGSKVFLYKDSILYRYFKSNGYIVFTIEDDLTQRSIDEPLTKKQVQNNIKKLEFLDFDTVQKKVENSLLNIQERLSVGM